MASDTFPVVGMASVQCQVAFYFIPCLLLGKELFHPWSKAWLGKHGEGWRLQQDKEFGAKVNSGQVPP